MAPRAGGLMARVGHSSSFLRACRPAEDVVHGLVVRIHLPLADKARGGAQAPGGRDAKRPAARRVPAGSPAAQEHELESLIGEGIFHLDAVVLEKAEVGAPAGRERAAPGEAVA